MTNPDCKCFAPGQSRGETMSSLVASDATRSLLTIASLYGVCNKAMRHVTLTTIIIMLDNLACLENECADVDVALSEKLFREQCKTLIADLTQRRGEMDAWLQREEIGASLQ